MLNQLLTETRLALTLLAQEKDKNISTCWRLTRTGVRGHVLASFRCGGRMYTTREAFVRWSAAINGEQHCRETPRQRERQIEQAERRAEELGI